MTPSPLNRARLPLGSDRAAAVAVAVMQIAASKGLTQLEVRRRLTEYLRDEFATIKWQIANDRRGYDEA